MITDEIKQNVAKLITMKRQGDAWVYLELLERVGAVSRGEALKEFFPYLQPQDESDWTALVHAYDDGELTIF